ncbi:MAG: ABC transporter ATP-binding protein [Syntrophomonadaceae bacterium]|nr:ABC transporter ATP-binding protein [Syntrophomonadaceae bacterium]
MMEYILEVSDLSKSFDQKKAVDRVSLKVAAGEIFGFLGPNGAGKTTTIRMILNLIHPDQGVVRINGFDIKKDFSRAISFVGSVVETPKFYLHLTGYQNLLLIANLHPQIPKERINELIEIVGLTHAVGQPVSTYSLGMKQRLGIARAFINKPKLVFLDEPMNGLDPQGMIEVRELIRKMAADRETTFFITSHLLKEVEQLCTNIAIIKDGRIINQGKVGQLLAGNSERIEIYTSETDRAIEVIQNLVYVKNVISFGNRLVVELDRGCSAQLNSFLVSKNIGVQYLIPNNQSLEDFFIRQTQGG